jgi:hypothetical protein
LVALVSDKDTAISINETPAEKVLTINVHLKTDYDAKLDRGSITISGIRYLLLSFSLSWAWQKINPA